MFERNYGTGRGSSSGSSSRGSRGSYNSRPREMTTVTCSECGKETQVPFKPDGSRPVYCGECYQNHKPARAPRRY